MRFSLYVEGVSWVHRLDPVTKLIMVAVGLTLTFILTQPPTGGVLFLVLSSVLASAGVLKRAGAVFAGVGLIALTFFIVQGLVYPGNQTAAFAVGPAVFYQEGLLSGLKLTLRLLNILSATLLLVLATRPSDLVESLMRRGLPARFGYVIIAVLQIIPTMAATTGTIMDAQRSRGMETEGRLWTRIKAFVPLMGPLVTSSLIATEERALALEVRGFAGNNKVTFLKEEVIPPYAWVVRISTGVALIAGIVGRVILT